MSERLAKPEVHVLPHADAAVPWLLDEVRRLLARTERPLLGLATGGTYTAFLRAFGVELRAGRLDPRAFFVTHLDEYLGFEPGQRGGMVHELRSLCPTFDEMLAHGTFWPVPYEGCDALLRAHGERLQRAGGVALQLLGIGRNGHLAFNEPGTPFDRGFHTATLTETTRDDARARFAPAPPPLCAVTSGPATIFAARRLVLCAFGRAKAEAVRLMLQGEVSPACPASLLLWHPEAVVLLDAEAASGLTTWSESRQADDASSA